VVTTPTAPLTAESKSLLMDLRMAMGVDMSNDDARAIRDRLLAIEAAVRADQTARIAGLEAALSHIREIAEADYGDDPLPDRMKVLLVLIPLAVEKALRR
jgi:hypothetical protein